MKDILFDDFYDIVIPFIDLFKTFEKHDAQFIQKSDLHNIFLSCPS